MVHVNMKQYLGVFIFVLTQKKKIFFEIDERINWA